VSVQRGICGGALQPLNTNVDASAFPEHSDLSFGKRKDADYQFDDLRLQADTISALSTSRRYFPSSNNSPYFSGSPVSQGR
jgi:hypothetical protein